MSRITDNEAIQAARALKEYCDSHTGCDECVFRKHGKYTRCGLISPPIWSIPDLAPTPAESQDSKRLREREEFFGEGQ